MEFSRYYLSQPCFFFSPLPASASFRKILLLAGVLYVEAGELRTVLVESLVVEFNELL